MLRFLFLTCLVMIFGPANGQHFYFRQYQVENGLSHNMITCSVQDAKGFLWFGTRDGLNRFDGYTFKVFRNNPNNKHSIGNNNIKSLCADAGDKIWVGTEKGLYNYDPETESFRLIPTKILAKINDMKMDSEGNLWFIVGNMLTRYDKRTGKLTYYDKEKYFIATTLCFIGQELWVGTLDGTLEKYDAGTDSFTSFNVFKDAATADNRLIERLFATADGDLLIGTVTHGAKIFSTKACSFRDILTHHQDNTSIFARQFIQISNDEYWMGTESGIYIYNKRTGIAGEIRKRYNDPYSLSDNCVNTMCRDADSGLWIGTNYGGLNYYSKRNNIFKKYFPKEGENSLNGNVIREIQEDRNGNLWIGTEDAGLNKLNVKTGRFSNFQPNGSKGSLSYKNVHSMLVDGDELWLGIYIHGLDVMDIKTGKIKRRYETVKDSNLLKSDFIYCIYRCPDNQIMLGTGNGVYTYNRDKDNFSSVTGLPIDWYSCIFKDKSGTLWAGTFANGVHSYHTGTGQKANLRYDIKNPKSLGSGRINSIFCDSKGQLWFGTEGGLCQYNNKERNFIRYTTENGLPSNFILGILEDERRNLWITTSRGLVCFNLDSKHIKTYKKENGILNDQFNPNSAYKDKTGRMYFGSVKGLISFEPRSLFDTTAFDQPLYITGFQVYNEELPIGQAGSPLQKSISWTDKIELKYNQSSFSIDFAALNYTAPEATEYAYSMEGLEKGWTYLKANRKVYFTELSPGTYRFRVKASIGDNKWDSRERILVIRILPPIWLSIPACLLYAGCIITAVILLVRNYHKRVQNRNKRAIEKLELTKAKEMYEEKLDFFTKVAHEIKTPLTLIKGPMETVLRTVGKVPEVAQSLKIMNRNTNRLVDLTNQLLDFRQAEIEGFSLNFVRANISEMLMETYDSFGPLFADRDLKYTISLPNEAVYAWIDMEAFNKILTNLFGNAVKYAERTITVDFLGIEESSGRFTIEISNDGFLIPPEMAERIFEPFFRIKETKHHKGTGIGLALSLSLAKLHNGTIILKNKNLCQNTFSLTMPTQQDT